MIELLTYYVIVSVVFIGALESSSSLSSCPLFRIQKDVWLDTKITKLMVTHLSTRTPKMIPQNSSYKLAEIIRDTWPQLYYLKVNKNGRINTKSPEEGMVRCP